MRNRAKNAVVILMFIFFALPVFSVPEDFSVNPELIPSDFSDFDVGDVKICQDGNHQCQKVTCMDLCLAAGESANDCPLYCNTYTRSQPVRVLKFRYSKK